MFASTITDSVRSSLIRIFDYLPQLVGAIIILIIGYLVAKILQAIVQRILRRLRFDHALHTSPAGKYIIRIVESPSALAGRISFWIVFLIFVSFAASAINLTVLNHILNGIYSYIPNVVAAVIIFLIASAIAAGSASFVQRIMGRTPLSKIISTIIPAVTLSIATFMILDQLHIAPEIINITYTAIMGALALGLALAFGLGGRDLARDMLEQAYTATQRHSGAAKEELSRARENARRTMNDPKDRRDS